MSTGQNFIICSEHSAGSHSECDFMSSVAAIYLRIMFFCGWPVDPKQFSNATFWCDVKQTCVPLKAVSVCHSSCCNRPVQRLQAGANSPSLMLRPNFAQTNFSQKTDWREQFTSFVPEISHCRLCCPQGDGGSMSGTTDRLMSFEFPSTSNSTWSPLASCFPDGFSSSVSLFSLVRHRSLLQNWVQLLFLSPMEII